MCEEQAWSARRGIRRAPWRALPSTPSWPLRWRGPDPRACACARVQLRGRVRKPAGSLDGRAIACSVGAGRRPGTRRDVRV